METTKKKLKTFRELFQKAKDMAGHKGPGSGAVHIASALEMNQWSVERWPRKGAPQGKWKALMALLHVSAEELHEMNENAKNGIA